MKVLLAVIESNLPCHPNTQTCPIVSGVLKGKSSEPKLHGKMNATYHMLIEWTRYGVNDSVKFYIYKKT